MIASRARMALLVPVAGLCVALMACGVTTTADAPTHSPEITPVSEPSGSGPIQSPTPTLRPGQIETLALDALSPAAATLARQVGKHIGVAIYVPGERRLYQYNAEPQFRTASVVKLPIMLTVMDRAIGEGRVITDEETALIQAMIIESDNEAATALWIAIGGAPAVQEYLESNGILGVTLNETNWGDSLMSAESTARLLGKLLAGELLDGPHREFALDLLTYVDPTQDWGVVVAGEFEGETGVKNGWYPEYEGWVLASAGYVVPERGPIYTIAIFTDGWLYFNDGVRSIESIGGLVRTALFSE